MDRTVNIGFGFGRIDDINLAIPGSVGTESCGGVDLERSSDNKEEIGACYFAFRLLYFRNGLTKEHDVRPELPVVLPTGIP